jgi:hypothetical protein
MKRNLPILLMLLLLVVFGYGAAFAQTNESLDDSSDTDDAAPVQRVARLSFIQGDVSFLRAGVTEWAPAVENLPLLAGDQVFTERGARAEIQLGRGDFIRISENTELTISELSPSAAQFEITEGTAIISIERLSSAFGRFEVDTPNSSVVLQRDGLYRIDVRGERDSELIVRRGQADVSTDEGSFMVREGNRLFVDTSAGGRLELAADTTRDDWDQWSYDRDTTIDRTSVSAAPDYVINYETTYNDFYGVSDLSSYGTWTSYPAYGHCWIPRVGADWAPYRSGQWLWIPSVGWTWLASERWGWAPYHYGRWASLPGLGWAWVPGFGSRFGGYGYRDYHWRPGLVYFFNCSSPRGNYVGWYPLAPGERWHRPDYWRGRDGWRGPNDGRLAIISAQRHGMSILPYEGFIRRDRAFRPSAPTGELADSIRKGARHGLPEIRPTPVVAAPALAEGDGRKFRRIAAPPADIDRRGVVTRNPNSDSSLLGGHRERRTIAEGRGPAFSGGQNDQAGQDRHQDKEQRRQQQRDQRKQQQQAGSDSGGERRSQKIRVPLQNSSDSVNIDGGGRERKPNRDADRSTANDDASQRHRQERATSRDSGGSASGGQQNDQARQDRHQEKEQRREQQRQERHQEQQRQQQQQQQRSEHHQERQQQQAQQPEHHHHQEQQQQQEQRRKHE